MISLILVMAGSGQRMKEKINKVLLPLGDKKIYEHSIDLFSKFGFEIICVINPNDEINKIDGIKYVNGGRTRSESVYNGLKAATGDYVFIHDAARPLLKEEIVKGILDNIKTDEAYLCYMDVVDTIKLKDNGKLKTLNRDNIIRASTPQCAPKWALISGYEKMFDENLSFTDDISLIEHFYPRIKINLVESNPENFKITTKLDYKLALSILEDL